VIDPKGDLTNLLLHFPDLLPQDFQLWINPDEARRAKKTIEQAEEALAAAKVSSQSALESNKLGYEVGVRINIDVLNAQNQLFDTQQKLAKARLDTLIAQLRLKSAAGTLSETDLAAINALLE